MSATCSSCNTTFRITGFRGFRHEKSGPYRGVAVCDQVGSDERSLLALQVGGWNMYGDLFRRKGNVWGPCRYPSPRTTMTYTANNTLLPHWPSRGAISRVALLAAYSRAVFDHRCLRSIARIWREHRISNSEVRRMVFERNNSPSIDELITLHKLRWLDYVLRMPVDRLPRRALFAQPCEGWK
ncbi:hypothetical protein T265_01964 [Opisthorchis viverrini]|uniref:Uncharacterized protein n=1 Tax=Opisthorchis viverrini TaxID=6198 RepID=A0A075A844_OPIVI|nr:hypothetical protein T265_01964 [Opisthorchis viverrini]KER31875.1 hypothetical protein T265_01964 [Opisthorchis viverrini]